MLFLNSKEKFLAKLEVLMPSQNGFTIAEADLKDRFGYAAAFCHMFGASAWVCQLFLVVLSSYDWLLAIKYLTCGPSLKC